MKEFACPNHLHILVSASPNLATSEILEEIKKRLDETARDFLIQNAILIGISECHANFTVTSDNNIWNVILMPNGDDED